MNRNLTAEDIRLARQIGHDLVQVSRRLRRPLSECFEIVSDRSEADLLASFNGPTTTISYRGRQDWGA